MSWAEARMDGQLPEVFEHVYAEIPGELREQREELTPYLTPERSDRA